MFRINPRTLNWGMVSFRVIIIFAALITFYSICIVNLFMHCPGCALYGFIIDTFLFIHIIYIYFNHTTALCWLVLYGSLPLPRRYYFITICLFLCLFVYFGCLFEQDYTNTTALAEVCASQVLLLHYWDVFCFHVSSPKYTNLYP